MISKQKSNIPKILTIGTLLILLTFFFSFFTQKGSNNNVQKYRDYGNPGYKNGTIQKTISNSNNDKDGIQNNTQLNNDTVKGVTSGDVEINALDFTNKLAFPGAKGHGKYTTGGRGGKAVVVDTLLDVMDKNDGKTSLREAVQFMKEKRTVVFKVGGVFDMTSPKYVGTDFYGKTWKTRPSYTSTIFITSGFDNITIAGETAPAPGVIVKGTGFELIGLKQAIFSSITLRNVDPAHYPNVKEVGGGNRYMFIRNRGGVGTQNIILNNVSASWSTDDAISPYIGTSDSYRGHMKNITIQNSIIAEGDAKSSHPESTIRGGSCGSNCTNSYHEDLKKNVQMSKSSCHYDPSNIKCASSHSMGPVISNHRSDSSVDKLTFTDNYIAHNLRRNARFSGKVKVNWVNNVVYNFMEQGLHFNGGFPGQEINIHNNFYKVGPSTKNSNIHSASDPSKFVKKAPLFFSYFNSGKTNFKDNYITNTSGNFVKPTEYYKSATYVNNNGQRVSVHVPAPLKNESVSIQVLDNPNLTQSDLKKDKFFKCVGNARFRDSHDTRIINDFFNGSGRVGIGNNHKRDYSEYNSSRHPDNYDTDNDGMPNTWEDANGLNKNNPGDANGDKNNDGYSNIENFIHSLNCEGGTPAPTTTTSSTPTTGSVAAVATTGTNPTTTSTTSNTTTTGVPSGDVLKITANDFSNLSGYFKESGRLSLLKPTGGFNRQGNATATFNGDSGLYKIELDYLDEWDSDESTAKVIINGQTSSTVTYNKTPLSSKENRRLIATLFDSIQVNKGDTIRLEGTSNGAEYARFYSINLTSLSGTTTGSGTSTTGAATGSTTTVSVSTSPTVIEVPGNNFNLPFTYNPPTPTITNIASQSGFKLGDKGYYTLSTDITNNNGFNKTTVYVEAFDINSVNSDGGVSKLYDLNYSKGKLFKHTLTCDGNNSNATSDDATSNGTVKCTITNKTDSTVKVNITHYPLLKTGYYRFWNKVE